MSAFPVLSLLQDRDGDYRLDQEGGLTKRELFAAMAMQGLTASDGFFKDEALKATAKHLGIAGPSTVAVILAKTSVEFADALLAALEKTP
jgi:hypothetical protein